MIINFEDIVQNHTGRNQEVTLRAALSTLSEEEVTEILELQLLSIETIVKAAEEVFEDPRQATILKIEDLKRDE